MYPETYLEKNAGKLKSVGKVLGKALGGAGKAAGKGTLSIAGKILGKAVGTAATIGIPLALGYWLFKRKVLGDKDYGVRDLASDSWDAAKEVYNLGEQAYDWATE